MLDRTVGRRVAGCGKSVLLLGPRQVGKSTMCRGLEPDLAVNLADEETFLAYARDPGRIRREVDALNRPRLVVIDEVQRLPSILNTIQAIMDETPRIKFILTGSSARKLKRGGANLLPGRILVEHLGPLSIWELGPRFRLDKALQCGTLPGIYLDDREGPATLDSYANIYLREEIRAEMLAKNIGAYARFLDTAAAASGEWVNYSKIASDAEIPKETVRRFYTVLEETMIAYRIPPYRTKSTTRKISQRDRFIFFDVGVRNAVLGIHHQKPSPMEAGLLFEQWFVLQCIYFNQSNKKPWKICSYRTDAGAEVDIVLDTPRALVAIECKYGKSVNESHLRGLRSFEEVARRPVKKYAVYSGTSTQKFSKGEIAIPYQKFLMDVLPHL